MRLRSASLLLAALALAGVATAQSRTSVEQLERGSGAAAPHEAPQVGSAARDPAPAPQLSTHDGSPGAHQLSGPAEGRTPSPQLSSPGAGARATDQLAKGRPTAEGPTPLSTPAQGRDPLVERVQGDDRCDPQNLARLSAPERARCAQVIERRSAEFSRPEPPQPSPEERLLRAQAAAGADARTAARRLAEGEVEDSLAAQAIASGANRTGPEQRASDPRAAEPELSPEAQAVIEAIVQGAGASVTVR